MSDYKNIEDFYSSHEAARLSDREFSMERNAIRAKENAKLIGDSVTKVLSGEELLETYGPPDDAGDAMDGGGYLPQEQPQEAIRKGPTENVGVENALEKKILSGWRLPEDDNDPYFRGLRGSEISDMRRMQRIVLGEEEVNPNEEDFAKGIAGGTLKTIDSLMSLLERGYDMTTGEITEQGSNYKPEWTLSNKLGIEPIEFDTFWGPYWGEVVHYSSLATGILATLSASGVTLPTIGTGLSLKSKLATGILQGGLVGVGQDSVSINSHEQNASSMLIEKFPQMEAVVGPLATKPHDDALTIWLKNILEGIGFEALVGGSFELLGHGLSAAKRSKVRSDASEALINQTKDRANQQKAKAKAEQDEIDRWKAAVNNLEQKQLAGEIVDLEGMPPSPYLGNRGANNADLTNAHQGSPISKSTPYDNLDNLNKIEKNGHLGSVDSALTVLDAENIATDGIGVHRNILNKWKQDLFNDPRLKDILKKGKQQGRSAYSIFKQSIDRYGSLIGRSFSKSDWEAFYKRTGLTQEDIVGTEAFINSNFKIFRDVSIAAKELKRMGYDIFAADGPMKTIADRMVVAFETLQWNRVAAATNVKEADKALPQIHKETLEGVDLLMNFLDREAGEDLIDEVLTYLSTSHRSGKIQNFNNWMRQKMTGGDMLPGKNKQGALLNELHQVHINSMFGPKTVQRAIWGTGFNSYLTQFNDTFGAALRYPITRDAKQFKSQLASFTSMFEFIPDAFRIFKSELSEAFKPDAIIDTRFTQYGRKQFNEAGYENWLELEGSDSDKIVWNFWKTVRNLNGQTNIGRIHSGISRVMDASDKTFSELTRHRRVKEIAMRDALTAQQKGDIAEITPELLDAAGQLYEQKYYNDFGEIDLSREAFTKSDFDEVTYRTELSGMSKAFAQFVEQVPFIKPFHRFIRSGINGLRVKTTNMPLLNGLVRKEWDVALATPDDLSRVRQYGVEEPWDLEKLKGRQWARQALGMGFVFIAAQKYLTSGLSGNGPADVGMRNVMVDSGWERNTIELGGKRIPLEIFEPFDLMFKGVADIGDNMSLMGPQWAEDKLTAFAIVTAFSEAATNQTYLSTIGDLVDVIRGEPSALSRLTSTVANFVPFGGWRRALGQTLTNQYREINTSIWSDINAMESSIVQRIRKDNLTTEFLAPITGTNPLPLQYNMLNGKPLKETNVLGRAWRANTMLNIEPGSSPGQKLLWRSNYDLRVSVFNSGAPDNVSLKDNNILRSEFQKQIGLTRIHGENPEQWLNRLAKEPRIIESINEMLEDRRNGNYNLNPIKSYYHNRVIRAGFNERREMAWAIVRTLPEAQVLIQKKIKLEAEQETKLYKTTNQELPLHPAR